MSAEEALAIAEEKNLDLVKIAPGANPPVCKIMDFGKYRFEKAKKDDLFNMHLGLYLKKYQKLEKIGLIEIDLHPDNGLEYDCTLTSKGKDVLNEISALEKEWESVVNINDEDLEVLRKLALDSFEISYRHKKKKGFIF